MVNYCQKKKKQSKRHIIISLYQKINETSLSECFIIMDRVRWSEKSIPFQSLVENPSIQKPTLGK